MANVWYLLCWIYLVLAIQRSATFESIELSPVPRIRLYGNFERMDYKLSNGLGKTLQDTYASRGIIEQHGYFETILTHPVVPQWKMEFTWARGENVSLVIESETNSNPLPLDSEGNHRIQKISPSSWWIMKVIPETEGQGSLINRWDNMKVN